MATNAPIICSLARVLTGLTFVISGLTKSLNLFSTSLKVQEYFEAVNVSAYNWMYDIMASTLITTEIALGLLLTFGFFAKTAIRTSFALISFFLILTFYMYIGNNMQECGCFGGIFSLTIKETLFKNIFLLLVCAIALNEKAYYKKRATSYTIISFAISIVGGFYGLFMQPLYDTSAYTVGKTIMGEEMDVEFVEGNGERPSLAANKIHETEHYTALIIVRDLKSTYEKEIKDIEEKIRRKRIVSKNDVILITSTPPSNIEKPMRFLKIGNIDYNLSKEIIQSNLGVIILKGGKIKSKWQQNSLSLQRFSVF